jgi:Holliday junction resolvase RusA-like endonuclease
MKVDVIGKPVPQGSKRVFNGRLVDVKHKDLRAWRDLVGQLAAASTPKFFTGPVYVALDFYLARPKGHYGSGKNSEMLKPSAPSVPNTKPDIDKLARAVLDALTGAVIRDDSQVVVLVARKHYASLDHPPGVTVSLEEVV